MRLTKDQQTAYHEAAHVVAALHVDVTFESVELHIESADDLGNGATSFGRVRVPRGSQLGLIFASLAGPAANKYMTPGYSWSFIAFTTGRSDYLQAWEQSNELGLYNDKFVDGMVSGAVLPFVRDNWPAIAKLGDALLSAPARIMTYEQCRAVLGMEAAERNREIAA